MGITAGFCQETSSSVHRFLISGPDLRIDAGFCLFMPSCVHRFLISSPDLGIDAGENGFACYGRGGNDFPRPILIFVAAKKNGPPAAHRRSGKEEWPPASHRRCGKEEWSAFRMTVVGAGGDNLPRRRHNPKLKAAGVVTVPVGSRCRSRSVIVRRLPMTVSQRNFPSAPDVTLAA